MPVVSWCIFHSFCLKIHFRNFVCILAPCVPHLRSRPLDVGDSCVCGLDRSVSSSSECISAWPIRSYCHPPQPVFPAVSCASGHACCVRQLLPAAVHGMLPHCPTSEVLSFPRHRCGIRLLIGPSFGLGFGVCGALHVGVPCAPPAPPSHVGRGSGKAPLGAEAPTLRYWSTCSAVSNSGVRGLLCRGLSGALWV